MVDRRADDGHLRKSQRCRGAEDASPVHPSNCEPHRKAGPMDRRGRAGGQPVRSVQGSGGFRLGPRTARFPADVGPCGRLSSEFRPGTFYPQCPPPLAGTRRQGPVPVVLQKSGTDGERCHRGVDDRRPQGRRSFPRPDGCAAQLRGANRFSADTGAKKPRCRFRRHRRSPDVGGKYAPPGDGRAVTAFPLAKATDLPHKSRPCVGHWRGLAA